MTEGKRLISETPDKWVVIGLKKSDTVYYKVFASWAGGYLDGDRWKMNSGISGIEEDEENFYFKGESGSCYKCHKKGYGVSTSYSQSLLDRMLKESESVGVETWMMESDTDWSSLLKK